MAVVPMSPKGVSMMFTVLFFATCSENGGVHEFREVARPTSQQDFECSKRSLETCRESADCVAVQGRRLDRDQACWTAPVLLGCRATNLTCGLALTAARNPEGTCFLFNDTCIPIDWAAIYGLDDKLCHSSTKICANF